MKPQHFNVARWIKTKQFVFERDNWTCQLCGKCKGWKVAHHTSYLYGYYNPMYIITLCDDPDHNCHTTLHAFDIRHQIKHDTKIDWEIVRQWEQYLGVQILSYFGR